ncbi:hypothetical protein BK764_11195 [Bacillus thuringiensis serovar israelensis]|uniref:CRISPR-associated DxTHG motif protein n=1 Tax=Bacillus thuringiensis TaxID=1428 RepID=A0A7D4A4R2_BACTU|nr:CRISPR-associated DxTHG motif protein [Bacillus thuringiensis]NVO39745.1 CRISPR-associated DxTHG motif protein [Bacillus thuringiensis serovar israelensis]OTX80316.1 hypothetical protein BK719_00370 [Bacillus thuringiensis serovar novosibirsk]MCC4009086.1 CRISPR-associated DxTHG motif protein [Bacillus thuringiensis]MCC4027795.1 CRISPR-associated DxTHG motif protein [Bacillus thuringiensis]
MLNLLTVLSLLQGFERYEFDKLTHSFRSLPLLFYPY